MSNVPEEQASKSPLFLAAAVSLGKTLYYIMLIRKMGCYIEEKDVLLLYMYIVIREF